VAERVVLDASPVLAMLRSDVGDPAQAVAARGALRAWIEAGSELAVPPGFWTELLDGVTRGRPTTAAELAEALHVIDELDIATVDLDRPGLLLVADVMERHGIDAGRAAYLVVAELLDARLATLDPRTAAAAGARLAPIGSTEAAPAVVDDAGRAGSLPDYRGLGAFLGELRRRAAAG
jgi:predicted nucleic acid-binding protein